MKAPVLWFALAVSATSLVAAEVAPGASVNEALATLGSPRGRLQVGTRNLLYYERGEIEVQEGRVTRVDLRTPEEHAAQLAREEHQRKERDVRRQELTAAGAAERDAKLADENFRAAPLAYQVSYWQNFVRRYPGVSVVEPLTIARLKLNEQLEEKQRQDRAAQRREKREEQEIASREDRHDFIPLSGGSPYYRQYRPYYTPSFGEITYDFWDKPLPPYSTPSGNPAGEMHGSVVDFPASTPVRSDRGHDHGQYPDQM